MRSRLANLKSKDVLKMIAFNGTELKRLRAVRRGIRNPATGRFITMADSGENVPLTGAIRRLINERQLQYAQKPRQVKKQNEKPKKEVENG